MEAKRQDVAGRVWFPTVHNAIRRWRGSQAGQLGIYVSGSVLASAWAEPGDLLNIRYAIDALNSPRDIPGTLAAHLKQLNLAGFPKASLVLAPDLYSLLIIDKPEVADAELKEAVRWKVHEQLEFSAEDACIDVFPLPEGAARGNERLFVAAAERQAVRNVATGVVEAGVNLDSIDITELALRNLAWRRFPQLDQSIAILSSGAHGGLISLSRGDSLYLARRILACPPALSQEKWRYVKDQLLLQTQRSLDYYQGAMGQVPCKVLVVNAQHEYQQDLMGFFAEILPIPVRSLAEVMASETELEIVRNGSGERVNWSAPAPAHLDALADGLPALGGALRSSAHESATGSRQEQVA